MNLDYVRIHGICRVIWAEYAVRIPMAAPQEPDDCFAALSEHGDAANAACGEERDYESRPSRSLPFRSRLARPLPLGVVSHTAHRVHALFFCFRD